MIVTSKGLFEKARELNFAIPSANYIDQLSASAYVEVAEEEGLPLILSFAQAHQQFCPYDDAIAIGKYYAENAKVPVVLHLDHGTDKDFIFKAIDAGFKSVMIDASFETFDENVRKTKEIVEYAHANGVVVEAEIGHVGGGDEYENQIESNNVYTTVEEAKKFAELTNVDSLAISIGTAHGTYKGTPSIDFERLVEIRNAIGVPLVLHGGSSSGDENLNRCAVNGISKINIYTDFLLAAYDSVEKANAKTYFEVRKAMKDGMKDCLKHYYEVFETYKYKE